MVRLETAATHVIHLEAQYPLQSYVFNLKKSTLAQVIGYTRSCKLNVCVRGSMVGKDIQTVKNMQDVWEPDDTNVIPMSSSFSLPFSA